MFFMSSFIGSYAVLGVIASFFGVGMLWYSWVNKKRSVPLIITGWSIILSSIVLWAYAGGGDRGTAMGLLNLGVVALFFVAANAGKITPSRKKKRASGNEFIKSGKLPGKVIFKNIGWWLFLFLGCGIPAYIAALGFHEVFIFTGTHLSNALFWALFLFPIIWGALAIHMLASGSMKHRGYCLLGCCLFGVLMLAWGN